MKLPTSALQRAMFAALRADAALRAFFAPAAPRVFDDVPVDSATGKVTADFPFIHLGEDDVLEDADQCEDGAETHFTLHIYSRAVGRIEARALTDLAAQCLDADIAPDGHQIVIHQIKSARDGPSGDGNKTKHRLLVVRYVTAPTS